MPRKKSPWPGKTGQKTHGSFSKQPLTPWRRVRSLQPSTRNAVKSTFRVACPNRQQNQVLSKGTLKTASWLLQEKDFVGLVGTTQ